MIFEKKIKINADDVVTVFHKYDVEKVMALLKEVAHYVYTRNSKIDWEALVEGTKTGITNAKEYQRLWRHLAYRNDLIDRLDCGVEPMDDDSDLECELEASPAVSSEALTDVAVSVKELISSCLPCNPQLHSNSAVEAPLNVETPNEQSSAACVEKSSAVHFVRGEKLPAPISAQKQCRLTLTSTQVSDANGAAGGSFRKKRKKWTEDEDAALIAAVQKFGEKSWNIISKELGVERSTGQLTQRWASLKRQNVNMHVVRSNSSGRQLSQAQLAARHAMSLALNMPVGNLPKAGSVSNVGMKSLNPMRSTAPLEASLASSSLLSSHLSKQASAQLSPEIGSNLALRSQPAARKPPPRSNITPHVLQAAAVAAGARIATPEDAASLLKAAHANKAVHIMPGGGSLNASSSMSIPRVSNIIPKKIENIQENRACHSGDAAVQQVHEDRATLPIKEAVDERPMALVNERKVHLQESRALPSDMNQSQQNQAEKCLPVSVALAELQQAVENPKSSEPSDISITISDQDAISQNVHIKVGCENHSTKDATVKEGGDYHSTIECQVA